MQKTIGIPKIPGTLQSHVKLWPSLESLKGKRGYCYEFLSFFISLDVSSHYAVLSFVGLIHVLSIVSFYVLLFVSHVVLLFVSHVVLLLFYISFQLFICLSI